MGLVRISGWTGNNNQIYENLINEAMFRTRCCIPCVIQSYNKTERTVECQPAIREKIINEDGTVQYVNLPILVNVPVVFPSCGSFEIELPIVSGDECLVLFSDLSIDNFWLKGNVQNPVEVRRHDLSDGIAIPCNLSLTSKKPVLKISVESGDIKFTGSYGSFTGQDIYNLIYTHYHTVNIGGAEISTSSPKDGSQ